MISLQHLRSAERCWGGGGRRSLRPGGHGVSRPGRSHRWKLGCAHQSGRDVPPKKRGEWNWEKWLLQSECQKEVCSVFENWHFKGCLFQGVTHQQWYLFNDFLIEPIDKVNIFDHSNWMLLKYDVWQFSKLTCVVFSVKAWICSVRFELESAGHPVLLQEELPHQIRPPQWVLDF